MLGILVFGSATYGLLPVAALPTVDFPTISVSASLPGAAPDTMASSVATPLEQQFAAIQGLSQMTSTSGLGSTSITLQFQLSRDIDGAAQDVQTAINAAGGTLPKDLPSPPTYRKTNPTDRAVLVYAIYSDAMPIYKVDDYAYTLMAQKMSAVNGVSQVIVAGQQTYAPHIQLNPEALASRGIGLEDVRTALSNATLDNPKGNLEGPHVEYTIDTNDQLFDAEAFSHVIVAYRKRRARPSQGCRRRHRFDRAAQDRGLVWQQALRTVAGAAGDRRQQHRDRSPDQRLDAAASGLDSADGACRARLGPFDHDSRFRIGTSSSRSR